jgi:antibiotic biosynthesis monooxygenase (ABM) superfamily enzyme
MSGERQALLDQLEEITTDMNVPSHKTRSVAWLQKKMVHSNKDHPRFKEAQGLVDTLYSMGVR